MQENQKRQRERQIGAKYLLSGLTICGQCGSAYCGHHQRGPNEYFYYRCIGADKYRREHQVICDNVAVNGNRLEEYVWQDVCKLLQDPKRIRTELERRRNQNVSSESNLNELVRRVAQVRSRIDRLIDAYESGLLEKAEFESRIVTLRSEHDRESFAISSLRGTLNESDDTATAESVLEQLRTQVGAGLETASEELKRDVIKLLVRRIEIHREEIRLVYKVPQNPFDRRPEIRSFLPHCLERAVIPSG